jgi:hypothetical protein
MATSDDAFAAFLNNNGEIQVENKIYKYNINSPSKPKGNLEQ